MRGAAKKSAWSAENDTPIARGLTKNKNCASI
jgi:hypothetical protein